MKKGIIPSICMVLSLVIIAFLFMGVRNFTDDSAVEKEKYSTFRKLVFEQEDIIKDAENNIEKLNKMLDSVDKKATVGIVVCGINEEVYTTLFPLLQERGIPATLVITKDNLTGDNLMNKDQLDELADAGWNFVPGYVHGDGNLGIASAAHWIENNGYSSDGTVFVDTEHLTDELTVNLPDAGYTTVINNRITGSTDLIVTHKVTDPWIINAMGYNSNGPKGILDEAVRLCGNLIFTVGFEDDENLKFDSETMVSMLDYLKSHEKNGSLLPGNIPEIREFRTKMDMSIEEIKATVLPEIEKYESVIAEAKAEIKNISASYMK